MLRKSDIQEEVQACPSRFESGDGVFRDYGDGSFLKKHPAFKHNQELLSLAIYFDELEIANPLGSKRGKHKLGKDMSIHSMYNYMQHFVIDRFILLDTVEHSSSLPL